MTAFGPHVLELDYAREADHIAARMRDIVGRELKRRGVVVALSGGIDSSCVAALAVRAFGKDRVVGLHMPERDSSADTLGYSTAVSDALGIRSHVEELTPVLAGLRCYERQDEAVREVIPEYGPGWRFKIVLGGVDTGYNVYHVVARAPDGTETKRRLPPGPYLQIVAATNFKQRTRKMLEYYHADRLHYATTGTPNRLEYDQGFFVKGGDGAADVKPIAHLYKTQVYGMARFLGLPERVCQRAPTTDTYSLAQGQDEFYFSLPYPKMDLCLWGMNHGVSAADVAPAVGLSAAQVEWVYRDIAQKRATTSYLHRPPVLVSPVDLAK